MYTEQGGTIPVVATVLWCGTSVLPNRTIVLYLFITENLSESPCKASGHAQGQKEMHKEEHVF